MSTNFDKNNILNGKPALFSSNKSHSKLGSQPIENKKKLNFIAVSDW